MKWLFAASFAVLVVLSCVAWSIKPEATGTGKVPLLWVSDDNPARREQIELFCKLNPQYDLRLDPTNTGMEKVIVQSIAAVGPDLFDCYDGFQLSGYVKSGIAWDITEELRKEIDYDKDVWAAAFPNFVLDGRAYGFPTNVSANAIWYNKDLFDACGLPYPTGPWTWEQFIPIAQKLTVREGGRIKHFGLLCDWWNWRQFVLQWGGDVYNEDGTRCILDTPEAIAGIQFLHDLMYKYNVMPSPADEAAMATAGGWGSGTITYFAGGRGAMAIGGRWWLCTLRTVQQEKKKEGKGLRLGAVEGPHGPVRVFRGYARATLVNKHSPYREQALDFIRYEARKPYNDLINAQADALATVKRFCYTPEYLHNPDFPEEDYNAVWRDVMDYAVPDRVSPFINGQAASRIIEKQLDLVKNDKKPVQKNLQRDPEARARYDEIVRRKNR
ncbi:MAG: extracellular solute-binding protein [Planctomycetota bacterium]|nr:extracellular solute-binding protein [Planctomycetota bacterium]